MGSTTAKHKSLLTKLCAGLAPRGTSADTPRPCRRGAGGRYAAAEIRAPRSACSEARRLAGRRLLADEAPALPLPSCTARCRCAYEHHADRRAETRRAADVGIGDSFYLGPQRRSGLDRRLRDRGAADRSYYAFMREHEPCNARTPPR